MSKNVLKIISVISEKIDNIIKNPCDFCGAITVCSECAFYNDVDEDKVLWEVDENTLKDFIELICDEE